MVKKTFWRGGSRGSRGCDGTHKEVLTATAADAATLCLELNIPWLLETPKLRDGHPSVLPASTLSRRGSACPFSGADPPPVLEDLHLRLEQDQEAHAIEAPPPPSLSPPHPLPSPPRSA